jgi:hypothetical protein
VHGLQRLRRLRRVQHGALEERTVQLPLKLAERQALAMRDPEGGRSFDGAQESRSQGVPSVRGVR